MNCEKTLPHPPNQYKATGSTRLRDRKKLNSGVRVRGVIKLTELGKFKLAIFQKKKS